MVCDYDRTQSCQEVHNRNILNPETNKLLRITLLHGLNCILGITHNINHSYSIETVLP